MFEDGIKTGGAEGLLQVRDLAEIVAERIGEIRSVGLRSWVLGLGSLDLATISKT